MRSEIPAQDLEAGCGKTFGSQFMFLVAWEKRLHSHLRKYQSLNKVCNSEEAFKKADCGCKGCALVVATLVCLGGAGHSSRHGVSPSAV